MRRRLLAITAALAGPLLAPTVAPAAFDAGAFFPGEAIAGPAGDIQSLGGLDVARDGTGGLVYLRADRVFASRLVNGAWQASEQLDAGLPGKSIQPVIAGADGGRLVVAFVNGETLYTIVKPALDQPWTAPQAVTQASAPAIDLSINGVAYVTYTAVSGASHDVGIARKARDTTVFTPIPASLDVDRTREAGVGTGRSRVAVAADGVALVVWGEGQRVVARRVFENRLSQAPQDLPPVSFQGYPGGAADLPDVDVEDDSSFAWVVFRQVFADGAGGFKTRNIARRLLGSQFEAPEAVDGLGFPIPDSVGPPRVALSGRGAGYAASASTSTAFGAVLKDDVFAPAVGLGLSTGNSGLPVAAVDETGDGVIAWQNADSTIHARAYDNVPTSRRPQTPLGDVALSSLGGGSSDAAAGLEAASDRVGNTAIAFVQGSPGARYIVVAHFDRQPGPFRLSTGSTWRNLARAPLRWGTSLELWGSPTYKVEVGRRVVAETTNTSVALPTLPDGVHRWRVTATDRRGQVIGTRRRTLRHDGTAPRARILVSGQRRRGRPVRVRVRATDAHPAGRRASGVAGVRLSFGDGASTSSRDAEHRYRRGRRYTLRVSVRDRANNVTTVRKQITIR